MPAHAAQGGLRVQRPPPSPRPLRPRWALGGEQMGSARIFIKLGRSRQSRAPRCSKRAQSQAVNQYPVQSTEQLVNQPTNQPIGSINQCAGGAPAAPEPPRGTQHSPPRAARRRRRLWWAFGPAVWRGGSEVGAAGCCDRVSRDSARRAWLPSIPILQAWQLLRTWRSARATEVPSRLACRPLMPDTWPPHPALQAWRSRWWLLPRSTAQIWWWWAAEAWARSSRR